jgi:tetratricopeptide (TPR) repeat protein
MAYRRPGDLDRAIEFYEKAISHIESFRGRLASQQRRAAFLAKHQQVYQELIEALIERHQHNPQSGDDLRAFAVYERSRARALLETIAEARLDIERDLEPDLRQKQDSLNARIAEMDKRLIAADLAEAERRQIVVQLEEAELEFDQLIAEIRRRSPRYAALRHPQPLSLQQTQALLDESPAIIAYSITKENVFAFLVTARTFRVERLAVSPKALAMRVQGYVDLIAQGDRPGWQDAGLLRIPD